MGILTGDKTEVKKEKEDKPRANTLEQKRREEEEEIKGKRRAAEAWQAYYEKEELRRDRGGGKERERSHEHNKKYRGSRPRSDRDIYQEGA